MTTNPLTAAIDHIRRITPSDDPWTAKDIAFEPQDPDEVDDSIATILNAVVAGKLINRHSRTAEVERLTKGSICEVAATNPSVMEYMRHWEGRAEKAESERDHAKAMLQSCIKGNITLKDKTQEALARLAAVQRETVERCAALLIDLGHVSESGETLANEVRGLRVVSDAQAALNKMLAEAHLEGWRAGRDAAAGAAERSSSLAYSRRQVLRPQTIPNAIRALPEPQENSHE